MELQGMQLIELATPLEKVINEHVFDVESRVYSFVATQE